MSGIVGFTPVIIKKNKLIRIITIEKLFERFVIYPLFLRNNKGYDTREPQTNKDLIVGPPTIIGSDGITYKEYIFDYDKDYVYRVISSGFYNAGVGGFIIKEFEGQN